MIEIANALLMGVFFVVGLWTSLSWLNKQLFILKNALKFKKLANKDGYNTSLLYCYWRVASWYKFDARTVTITFKEKEAKND